MRPLLAAALLMVAFSPVFGQEPARTFRLGYLSPISSENPFNSRRAIVTELGLLGFTEGRNLAVEERYAENAVERLPALAREITAAGVDVIVAVGNPAIQAVKEVAQRTPVIMAFAGDDPVARGLVASLSRPGGLVTGIALLAAEGDAKRLELVAEVAPGTRRIALLAPLYAEDDRIALAQQRAMALGIELIIVRARDDRDYDEAFAKIVQSQPAGLAISSTPIFVRDAAELARRAVRSGLPTICDWRETAEAGCLISYGASRAALYRQAAAYVARIFRGEKPEELPVEQPTRFELVVNMKTARALGLALPPSLLIRADEVIE